MANIQLKKYLNKFNLPNTLLVIASYPEKGVLYSDKVCAAGGFTKNTLDSINLTNSQSIVVFTTILTKPEAYLDSANRLVIRCIKRNSPQSMINTSRYIRLFSKSKKLLFEFEFSSFGATSVTLAIPVLLTLIKQMGNEITVVLHQVLTSLEDLSGHLGISKSSLKLKILNQGLRIFYISIGLLTDQIIVLEEEFKNRLLPLIKSDKIVVIPHGIDTNLKPIDQKKARRILGINPSEIVILYFGFVTWYKGADIFTEVAKKFPKSFKGHPVRFIIAGGPSFTLSQKPHYQQFLQNVLITKPSNMQITGFIDETMLSSYFSASDLLVLPYRSFMSSSGPLSMAASFNKPVIMSRSLYDYLKTDSFKRAFSVLGTSNSLFFNPTIPALVKHLNYCLESKNLKRLAMFSSKLRELRSFPKIGLLYDYTLQRKTNLQEIYPSLELAVE